MAAALLIATIAALAAVSAALSLSYLRRVATLSALDARSLAASLRRLPAEDRLAELERRAPAGWERQLATDLLRASGDSERVAIANDAIADVAHRLDEAAGWPPAALRISALGALLVGAAAFLAGRADLILPVVAIGAAGALASLELGRRARSLAARQREALDALIDAVVVLTDPAKPEGARRSWRRRRAR